MFTRILALLSLLVCRNLMLVHSSIIPPPPPFNISHFLFPKVTTFSESSILPQPPQFLQGVLDAIANKEKWALEDIKVSELDVKKAKYGSLQRYEFGIRVGKSEIVLKMYEEPTKWMKLATLRKNGSSDFETLVKGLGSEAVIDSFKIEGPFELRAVGNDDNLSLLLPLNVSHSGLRRISVGKGITVEVKGAEEISIIHPPNPQQMPCGILNDVISIWPLCTTFPPIRIVGSTSISAYRTKRLASYIKTILSSRDSIQLLPDKCYVSQNYQNPRHLLSSVAFLEKVVRNLFNNKHNPKTGFGSLKLRIRASNVIRLQLQVEKIVRSNDVYWSTLAEWRTRPIVERAWFDVLARIEGAVMKPLGVKKVRPFIDVDSYALSSLLSNLSFTKFPSGLVPPEGLTLDVKW